MKTKQEIEDETIEKYEEEQLNTPYGEGHIYKKNGVEYFCRD